MWFQFALPTSYHSILSPHTSDLATSKYSRSPKHTMISLQSTLYQGYLATPPLSFSAEQGPSHFSSSSSNVFSSKKLFTTFVGHSSVSLCSHNILVYTLIPYL